MPSYLCFNRSAKIPWYLDSITLGPECSPFPNLTTAPLASLQPLLLLSLCTCYSLFLRVTEGAPSPASGLSSDVISTVEDSLPTILISYGYYYKVANYWEGLKKTDIYLFSQGSGGYKSKLKCQQGHIPSQTLGTIPLCLSLVLVMARSPWCSLAYNCNAPVSASVDTWCSPCVSKHYLLIKRQ